MSIGQSPTKEMGEKIINYLSKPVKNTRILFYLLIISLIVEIVSAIIVAVGMVLVAFKEIGSRPGGVVGISPEEVEEITLKTLKDLYPLLISLMVVSDVFTILIVITIYRIASHTTGASLGLLEIRRAGFSIEEYGISGDLNKYLKLKYIGLLMVIFSIIAVISTDIGVILWWNKRFSIGKLDWGLFYSNVFIILGAFLQLASIPLTYMVLSQYGELIHVDSAKTFAIIYLITQLLSLASALSSATGGGGLGIIVFIMLIVSIIFAWRMYRDSFRKLEVLKDRLYRETTPPPQPPIEIF